MKYLKREDGMVQPLAIVLVAVVAIVVGVAVYTASKSNQKNVQTANASPSPASSSAATASPVATPTPTDQDLITAAVRANLEKNGSHPVAGTKITLNKLQNNDAMVNVGGVGAGGFELLKKSQGAWGVVFDGQNIDPTTEAKLGFPQGFTNTGSFLSTVLYTY